MAKARAKAKQKAKVKDTKANKPARAAKAIAKKASNKSQDSPDWLRKAMAVPPKRKGRPPGSRNRPKIEPQQVQAKRGRKPMATSKPLYDPMDDPDLRAPDPKDVKLDQSLPPPKQHGPTPLVLEAEPEPAPLFDEVAAGEAIPYDNAEMLIAGTLGGSGDNHASAKHILGRFAEANWLITKGTDDTPAGRAIKSRKEADARAGKEDKDKDRKEFRGKATKEGDDAAF
jgi:hypothetical protein